MAADAHGDCLGYSGAHHIADGASAKIVEKAAQVLMHEKQLVGMPGWAENDRWDVEGVVLMGNRIASNCRVWCGSSWWNGLDCIRIRRSGTANRDCSSQRRPCKDS